MRDFEIHNFQRSGQAAMSFDPIYTIMNNIYLSLFIQKGDWFFNPDFGSRLYLLKNAKNNENTRLLAIEYAKEATKWLLESGRAKSIQIDAERDLININILKLRFVAVQPHGLRIEFYLYFEVS